MKIKITKICVKDGEKKLPTTVGLDSVVKKMRSESFQVTDLPWLLFGATFGRDGYEDVRCMTGLLAITSKPDNERKISSLLERVAKVPQTLLAFRSLDRHHLHLVVRVGSADGEQPASTEEYLLLQCEAHRSVTAYYESLTGFLAEPAELTLTSAVRMSFDCRLLYNPDAQLFPVMMDRRERACDDERAVVERQRLEFYACLQAALEHCAGGGSTEQEQVLTVLADNCRKALLPEEDCVRRTLWMPRFEESEDIVRKIFRAAYTQAYRGKPLSQMNQKERIARAIRDFFERRYQLRYNEVKQLTEFRPNDSRLLSWQPLTDRELKRIAFEEMLEGGQGWMIDIELYVNSSLVKRYNPVTDYLRGVGTWNRRKDYIEEYACRLKTDYERWPHFFHRWFLAMVAQALNKNRDKGNSMVPLLIGSQAMKKSTFCKNILPYQLREYYMDDIKMDNAEQVERTLGRMWLVNIDEFNAKTDREQAKIKRLLTESQVQVRRMRSDQYTLTPRLCSFIATTNERHPLTDPTGSRRYLCVEMTGQADMSGRVNHQQMFAQAVWEIENGVQYWFDNDDEREITLHNSQYQEQAPLEDVLATFFQPAPREQRFFMTATAIQQHLRKRLSTADVPTLNKLGRLLHRQHFPEGSHDHLKGYYLTVREGDLR